MVLSAGGLGGGGDIGLSVILLGGLEEIARRSREIVVVSFAGCRARESGSRVRGALVTPSRPTDKNFELALRILVPQLRTYTICTKEGWNSILEAVDYVASEISPSCWLASDIGGDGAVTGYESKHGSYKTDSIARAALAYASRRHGLRGIVAVGGLGLEGGGRYDSLDMNEMTATMMWHEKHKALLGVYTPSPRQASSARRLLNVKLPGGVEPVSVMLPLFAAAVEGRGSIFIRKGYVTGLHRLYWWHRYVFLLDARRSCEDSPICQDTLLKGTPPQPLYQNREYESLLHKVKRKGFENVLRRLIAGHSKSNALDKCRLH